MKAGTLPADDLDFEDVTVASVRAEEKSGGWSIGRSDGWSFFVPKNSPIAPAVGMAARFYGKGVGHSVRGLFLDRREVFYRTAAEHERDEREQRYGKDARDLVRKWDADEVIWTIEMGGLGPNYELALQVAAIEFAREGLDVPMEGPKEGHDAIWREVCDHALTRMQPWFGGGLSGAQFGAASWLAWQWVHGMGPTIAGDAKYKERAIMVSKGLPATGPAPAP